MVLPPRRIRVLRVITWLPIGGIERRLVAVLPRLNRELFDVSLVCVRERGVLADELEAAGVPVTVIPFRKRWDLRAMGELAALMRERQIDIVHSHMYRSNLPATVAARLAGVKHVWGQVHNVGTWETSRQAFMDRLLCRWREGMIAVSDRVRQDVMDKLRLPERRVKLIYNGVDIARFAGAQARREAMRGQLGAGEGDMVFLFAARLVEQKRCTDFLEALGRLQAQPGGERVKAWILGDGPLMADLQAQAARLPRPEGARFFGKLSKVEDYMGAADAFVLPSTKEGFSNALVEAMASGLPCVASDVGGNAEAVRDGVEGFIIPPLAVDRLSVAMETMWRDQPRRRAMAQAAAQRAQLYSLDNMVGEVERFYLELMGRA